MDYNTNDAQQAMAARYAFRKSYPVGERKLPQALPDARAKAVAWKQAQGHHTPEDVSRMDKCEAIADMLGMVHSRELSGSERWSTANDAWQGFYAYTHPSRNIGMFFIYTPYGVIRKLDILGGSKTEVEELRQHLVQWGLRPRRD